MNYHLRVYDNYHYADEANAYNYGEYSSYEEAESAAKRIVEESLEGYWERGMRPEILAALYTMNGEDPVILPDDYPEGKRFSGRDHANVMAEVICDAFEYELKQKEVQSLYQDAIKFATERHEKVGQKVKGTKLPYVVHLSNVAMEILMAATSTKNFNLQFAIQVALLHDTLEDTDTKPEEISLNFGGDIYYAITALTKNKSLPKEQQLLDSIERIKRQPKEVWAVKLADRITNLQPAPKQWSYEKRKQYLKEAQTILNELGEANEYLAERLKAKISEYKNQNKRFLLDNI